MSAAVIIAAALIVLAAYGVVAVMFPQHVPLPLIGRLLERLSAPPEMRLPKLRRPRLVKRGMHHADSLHVRLGNVGTLPRKQVSDRPPWDTAELPVLREVQP